MARCRNCGTELPEGAKFCSVCGQDQAVSVPHQQRIQTPNVNVPPPQQGSSAGTGFGLGFGAAIGWIVGGCLVTVVLFVLMFAGCAVLAGIGASGSP